MTLDFLRQDVHIDGRVVRMELVNELNNPDRLFRDSQRERRTRVPARRLALGVMSGPRTFVEEWTTEDDLAMQINYDRRQITLFFNRFQERYRLEFSFKDMTNGELLMERDNQIVYFTIQLKFPARFWVQNKNAMQETKTSVVVGGQWERITELPMAKGPGPAPPTGRSALTLQPDDGKSRLGVWTTYRVKFVKRSRDDNIFEQMLSEAAEYNLVPRDTSNMPLVLTVQSASNLPRYLKHKDRTKELPFDVLYMLESLILSYQFNEYNLDEDFYTIIKQLEPSIITGIFDILYTTKKRTWAPLQSIQQTYNEMGVKVGQRRVIPEHCAMIRKIIVTPTTMYLQPPSIETTNRVVRHYHQYEDRFVRVQFVDEGMTRISASHSKTGNDAIYDRVFKALRDGIKIGTRRYEFLAFSSSQLRDHGGWFFAPTVDLSVKQIRHWMGSFSKEKIVAKHAVRMGQVSEVASKIQCNVLTVCCSASAPPAGSLNFGLTR
ncbi:RNA dependent RNA polymerase-domain-containing protein [Fennellomyces sp. T-0311]|nr:RNA dependent RNA polymerase-domain-containing protein [Fennellomyces sp. T-0311]